MSPALPVWPCVHIALSSALLFLVKEKGNTSPILQVVGEDCSWKYQLIVGAARAGVEMEGT